MRDVFADSGYWVALFDRQDALHAKATAVSQTLAEAHIVTSEMVLTEFLNHFAKFGPHSRKLAVRAVQGLQQDAQTTVVPQTTAQFAAALVLYAQREDKAWGLTDCASFLIMQEQGITEALVHDIHFRQAGFLALLRDD